MQHLDEETIHAWLDGELSAAEREAAEAHVGSCESCAAAVAEARGFIAASSRILTALDAMPRGVLPAAPATDATGAARMPKRFTIPRAWMAVAAVLVLGIGTAIVIRPRHDRESAVLAEAREQPLARADMPAAAPPSAARAEKPAAMPSAQSAGAGYAKAAPAASPVTDSARPRALALHQVIVTGAGTTVAREEVEPSIIGGGAPPQLVSRHTSTESGDTVVTTIYEVHGVRVSLIDRSPPAEARRSAMNSSDAVMAKARASVPAENSITWSDSTGRTRTLRGALSSDELERLKAQLFGATP